MRTRFIPIAALLPAQVRAKHAGCLSGTRTPDAVIHVISSCLHHRSNAAWLEQAAAAP